MKVVFATNRLHRCYLEEKRAIRTWGDAVGRRYIQRVDVLLEAQSLDELIAMRSLRLHPLKEGRRGQWSMTIIGRWRLIVLPLTDASDEAVLIEEVSNHYGD